MRWRGPTTRMTPASFSAPRATLPKDCIVLQGRPNGDRVTLMMAVDDTRVHDDDIADPPDIPEPPALRDRAAPVIIMLQGNFRQGVIEPILDASWAPGSNVFYYEAQISYDDGQSWSNAYQGDQPSFSKVVDYASLQLGSEASGPRRALSTSSRSSRRPSPCGRT